MSTVTSQQVQERVVEAITSFGPDPSQITRDATFEELDVDSLDLTEISQIIEEKYGVQLKGDDVNKIETVGDAVEMVVSRAG
jgi:acyl carrier protein